MTSLMKASGVSLLLRLLGAGLGFAATITITRLIGAHNSGYYFLALSIISFLSVVSRFGTDNTIVRFVGSAAPERDYETINGVLKFSLTVVLFLSALMTCLLFVFAELIAKVIYNSPPLAKVLYYITPALIFSSISTIFAKVLQGMGLVAISSAILSVFTHIVFLILLAVHKDIDVYGIAISYSIASLAVMVISLSLWRLQTKSVNTVNPPRWGPFIKSAVNLWLVTIMVQGMSWAGLMIASLYTSPSEFAKLAAALKVANLANFVLIAVNMVVAPKFAALIKRNDLNALNILVADSLRLVLVIAIPFCVMGFILSDFVMAIFGQEFEGSGLLLAILLVGMTINVVTGPVGILLTMSGNERDFRQTLVISLLVSIPLCLALSLYFGVFGSAIAISVSISLQNLIASEWVRKRIGINIFTVALKNH